MQIRSTAFSDGDMIPEEFTVKSPPLEFLDVPPRTVSLALVVEDPDVPRTRQPSGMFDHWVVWNLPADLPGLAPAQDPPGAVGKPTIGPNRYVGPAPPYGVHRYYFHLFALDTMLDVPVGSTKTELYEAMTGHVLAACHLMGRYAKRES